MKLLVLGGTRFLGRHLVETAQSEGHEITLFHRGQTQCDFFDSVEHIHGDRDGDLDLLAGRRWDAAIDTCGYVPRLVQASTRALADAVNHYTFVSSISVYPRFARGMDETASTHELDDPAVEEVTGDTYGGLKVLCEQVAETAMPGRVLHARSGLIVGAHDPTDRFTYWIRRVSMGGRMLVPERPDRPLQVIHAADMSRWFLEMAEAGKTGVYHVTGPDVPFTMGEFLDTAGDVTGGKPELVWVSEDFLQREDVAFWQEVPLCIGHEDLSVMAVSTRKAMENNLRLRPLEASVRDVFAWDAYRPPGTTLQAGLTARREAELLLAWKAGSS